MKGRIIKEDSMLKIKTAEDVNATFKGVNFYISYEVTSELCNIFKITILKSAASCENFYRNYSWFSVCTVKQHMLYCFYRLKVNYFSCAPLSSEQPALRNATENAKWKDIN